MREIGINLPIFLLLTLANVDGREVTDKTLNVFKKKKISQPELRCRETVTEDYDVSPQVLMRDAFYSIWQAAGYRKSESYNDDHEWVRSG